MPATGCRRSRSACRVGRQLESDRECCVCLLPTASCTPCGHPLCVTCWEHLRRLDCPLCRRELPSSAGALPIRCNLRFPLLSALPLVASRSETTQNTSSQRVFGADDLARQTCALELQTLPNRLATKIATTLQRETSNQHADGLNAVLACLEGLSEIDSNGRGVLEAKEKASLLLSRAAALRISSLRVSELLEVAHNLSDLIERSLLVRAPVLLAVGAVIHAHTKEECTDWSDLEDSVTQLLRLREWSAFWTLVEEAAAPTANQTFELTKRGGLERLPTSLERGAEMLQRWPTAALEATATLSTWVRSRLMQTAKQWTESCTPVSVTWWIDILRIVASRGLVDRVTIRELCDVLAPGLAREGVNTEATRTWEAEKRQVVVARQLATELAERPLNVHYMPNAQHLLLFGPLPNGSTATGSDIWGELRSRRPAVSSIRLPSHSIKTVSRSSSCAELGRNSPSSPASPSSPWRDRSGTDVPTSAARRSHRYSIGFDNQGHNAGRRILARALA